MLKEIIFLNKFALILQVLREIYSKLNENIKNSEKEKKDIIDPCVEHMKEFEKFIKYISESTKKNDTNGNKINEDLNRECIMKKNNVFPRINTELQIFQNALDRHSDNLNEIKFKYFINTLDFLNSQIKNIDDLVEEGIKIF